MLSLPTRGVPLPLLTAKGHDWLVWAGTPAYVLAEALAWPPQTGDPRLWQWLHCRNNHAWWRGEAADEEDEVVEEGEDDQDASNSPAGDDDGRDGRDGAHKGRHCACLLIKIVVVGVFV